ncbi:MAG: PKD domain-containing protein [Bernardetiaceae bacterium]|nr:PKD domain-containing protein [Bernardetiaceae bacterium]
MKYTVYSTIAFISLFFVALGAFQQKLKAQPQNQIAAKPESRSPLAFVENGGQWDESVHYRGKIPDGFIFAQTNTITYGFYKREDFPNHHVHSSHAHEEGEAHTHHEHGPARDSSERDIIRAHGIKLHFEGANANPKILPSQPQSTRYNYLIGNDERKHGTDLRAYSQLKYQNLYNGIDLDFYVQQEQLKYDFVLQAGIDPKQIKIRYEGAEKLSLENGKLRIATSINEFVEEIPLCYQIIGGERREVKGAYKLKRNVVSFEFPEGYDKNYPLIIDPVLVFSTFSGATDDNWGNTATFDRGGNLYSGGVAFGSGFPVTPGAFSVSFSGNVDVAILKFNPTGENLLYATFLGGVGPEVPHSMIVAPNNELIILGTTGSPNFPVTASAFQTGFAGGPSIALLGAYGFNQGIDIFLSRLRPAGNALTASTFIGGSNNDGMSVTTTPLVHNYGDELRGDIAIEPNTGNVYIATTTFSSDFPAGGSSVGFPAPQAGVVMKFNPNFSSILWARMEGGMGFDNFYSVKVHPITNDVYVCGGTTSPNLLTHAGAVSESPLGREDGTIYRFNSTGGLFGTTYIGTPAYDQVYFIDIDEAGFIYTFGQTRGDFPIFGGAYRNLLSGQFLQKINPELTRVIWSTTIGNTNGRPNISPTAFMVNSCNQIYLAGWGGQTNNIAGYAGGSTVAGMPTTSDAIKRASRTGTDFYLMVLTEDARDLAYATFFGSDAGGSGEHVDGGTSRFDKETGIVYHAVCGACAGGSFPTTPGVWAETNSSPNCNNAAFKIAFDVLAANFEITDGNNVVQRVVCAPAEVVFDNRSDNGRTYEWYVDGVQVSTEEDVNPYVFDEPGEYEVTLIAYNPASCIFSDTVVRRIEVLETAFAIANDTTICRGESVQLLAEGATRYEWSPAESLSNPNIRNPIASPTETTTYTVEVRDGSGCENTLSITVEVIEPPIADFEASLLDPCDSLSPIVIQNNSTGDSYFWDFGDGRTSTLENPPNFNYNEAGNYTITLIVQNEFCEIRDTVSQEVTLDALRFSVIGDQAICFGESVQLNANGGSEATYIWTPSESLDDPNSASPIASPTQTTTYTVRIIAGASCEFEDEVTVSVTEEIAPDFEIFLEGECGEAPTVRIENNSRSGENAEYRWDFGNGRTSTDFNPAPFTYRESGAYEIQLIIGENACADTLTIPVEYFINPGLEVLSVSDPEPLCFGDSVQIAVETNNGVTYSWTPTAGLSNPNIANPIAAPETTTTYRVRISDVTGLCQIDTAITVTVSEQIQLDFNIGYAADCENTSDVLLQNNSQGATDYVWFFGTGDSLANNSNSVEYAYTETGEYEITLVGRNGSCNESFTKTVFIEGGVPVNVITPNGDGKNDFFIINKVRDGWKLQIFDRWGKEVFRSDNYQNDWGSDAQNSTYFYQLISPDGVSCKGWIQVLKS